MYCFEHEHEIVLWVPRGENIVSPGINTSQSVQVNDESSVQVPVVSENCRLGNEELVPAILSREMTTYEYYRCLLGNESTQDNLFPAETTRDRPKTIKPTPLIQMNNQNNANAQIYRPEIAEQKITVTNQTKPTATNDELLQIA